MKDLEIKEAILQLLQRIAPDIDPKAVEMDDNIRDFFGMDSFDFLQFIIGIDEEFGIKTAEEDYGKITSLNDLIEYLKTTK